MRIGSLFAGIGGIDLAFMNAGFEIGWQVEVNDFCQQVLAKNFPGVARYGDIYDCVGLPYVDVITAGFPCQPFSVAGKGLGDDDERYLVPEMLRVIDEVRPEVVFLENVPRFATLDGGRYFAFLVGWFAENGYDVQWQHISAADIGAPHKRERWFCVATANADSERRATGGKRESEVFRADGIGQFLPPKFGRDTVRHESCAVCGVRPATAKRGMVYANCKRCGEGRESSQYSRKWFGGAGSKLGYADGKRLERCGERCSFWQGKSFRSKSWFGFKIQPDLATDGRTTAYDLLESGLGGGVDGIPYRVDGHQFPAPANVPQYPWEPSRTTDRKDLRKERITALGNAVVPQVILPIAQEIYDYLMEV